MRLLTILALHVLIGIYMPVFGQKALPAAFFRYQVGLQLGIGQTSAPGVKFPFSSGIGVFMRRSRHAFGFRRDYHTELQIFKEATYYRFRSLYYGNAWVKKNSVFMPQFGIGSFVSNFPTGQNHVYSGLAAEVAIEAALVKRGNGIGTRVFFNWNEVQPYIGFQFLLNVGYSWTAQEGLGS